MPLPQPTIGDWSSTTLIKFIKNIIDQQPPRNLPAAVIGTGTVTDSLELRGSLVLPNSDYTKFGGTGAPPLLNSWVNWGAPYYPAGYWQDPLGFVHLRGVIRNGTVGSPLAQLPPGLKPAFAPGPFIVLSNGATGRVDIGTDGTITPLSPSSNVYVVLDGIHFRLT